ncbi:MAG: hypothetical protein DI535_24115 [Citrobacter freundii]|nr:MAG: hypothetical protein DI535_24115 [Citrobacter freundii]
MVITEKINIFQTEVFTNFPSISPTKHQNLRMRKLYLFLFSALFVFGFSAVTSAQYCAISFPSGAEPITSVRFNTLFHQSESNEDLADDYENFTITADTTTVFTGQTHIITVTGNTVGEYTNRFDVYIDWNQDGDFEDDGEHVFIGAIFNSTGTDGKDVSAKIDIPLGALPGYTRMRVTKRYNTSALPCNSTSYGQAEDYTIAVVESSPCVLTPSGGTIEGPASSCPGAAFELDVTGATFGSGLTYQWQSSPDGTIWTDIPGATSKRYIVTGLPAATHFRRQISCTQSGGTAYSTELEVTVTPIGDCYCPTGSEDIDNEYIASVSISGGIENSTDNSSYSDYSASVIASVFQGQVVKLTIASGVTPWYSTDVAYVYADFNQDGDFSDPGEFVGQKGGNVSPYNIFFTVPANATLGTTRLRIKFGDTDGFFTIPNENDPCQTSYTFGETEDYGLLITVPPACAPPSGLTAIPSSPTEELISWTASITNASGGYVWEVRSFGDGGSGAAGLEATGTTAAGVLNATVTGLSGGSNYFLWVRSDCGGNGPSVWEGPVQFTTVCDPVNIPFVQNFDATVEPDLPSCVVIQDLNGANTWQPFFGGSPAASSDPVSMVYGYDPTTPANDWFFIQGLNLTAGKTYTLSFKYKASAGPTFVENLEVKYGTAPNAAAMTTGTLFSEIGIASDINSPFETATVTFTPTSSGAYYIGFHVFSDADQAFLIVDDITVESCSTPTEVKAFSTTPNSAELHFVSDGGNFVIEYGYPGFIPGTGITAGEGTVITGATTSPVTITGLDPETDYDIYVRQSCDGGTLYSLNAKATIRTLCEPTTVPYVMNFEGVTGPDGYPGCTSAYDVNGSSGPVPNQSGGQWILASSADPNVSVSPTTSLRYLYDAVNTNRGADDWFFLQGLQLNGGTKYRIKFFYKGSDGPDYIEKLEVKYGSAASPASMSTLLWENNNINTAFDDPWDSARVEFTPPATGIYYIGLHAKSDADQAFLFLDDVSVRVAPLVDAGIPSIVQTLPTCPTPNFVMTANVVNYNLTPLNLATYPITVTANITGAATTTLTATVNSGTIAPGDTLKVPLPAFTFNAGMHNIVFNVSNPNDSENGNDSYLLPAFINPTPVAAVFTPATPQACAQITTQFSTAPPAPVDLPAVSSGALAINIPDNNPVGATHSLNVTGIPAGAQVTGFKVKLNVSHLWVSDLIINLKAPNGKVINLFNQKGDDGENLINMVISSSSTTAIPALGAPYTGTYKPDAAANVGPNGYVSNTTNPADLNGSGAWTLALMDDAAILDGTLESWSIEVSYGFPHPVVTWTPVTGLFTDAAGTVPYVAGTNAYSVYANPASETTYTATSTAAGCTNTSTVTVKPLIAVVNNWPAKICTSDESIALNATPAGGTWSGVGVSGNTFRPALTAVGSYPLTYRYTNPSGCTVTASVTAKVEDCPERIRLLRDDALILFPNPNNGNFSIRINSVLYNNLTMRVYTTSGLLVQNRQLTNLAYGRVIPIDLTVLPAGSYMVHFYYSGGVRTSDKTFPVIISK